MLIQVRAKTFVAVGHETANRDKRAVGGKTEAPDADLLANMELGVHSADAQGPLPQGGAVARAGRLGAAAGAGGLDSPGGGAHEEDVYYRGTSLPDDGIEMSSAPVRLRAVDMVLSCTASLDCEGAEFIALLLLELPKELPLRPKSCHFYWW